MSSLKDSLRLSLERLPDWMLDIDSRAQLLNLGALLPAVHHAGFEFHAGKPGLALDLQQGIELNEHNIGQILAKTGGRNEPRLKSINTLLEHWSEHDLLVKVFTQVWLEFDLAGKTTSSPSVFFSVAPDTGARELRSALLSLGRLLDLEQFQQPLNKALAALPDQPTADLDVTHIGVMLSRATSPIRLIRHLDHLNELPKLCRGEVQRQQALRLSKLLEGKDTHFSQLRWCDDRSESEPGPLAIECFFSGEQDSADTPQILAWLNEEGLCTLQEQTFLSQWPGLATPADHVAGWPESLLLESLSKRPSELSALEYRLGHIKLTASQGGPIEVKIYFGYVRRWLSASRR